MELTARVFSAKGAAFISSLGQRPRNLAKTVSAESAIHSGTNLCGTDGELVR
jgi:hypothetical protein